MMKRYDNPQQSGWAKLAARPYATNSDAEMLVATVFSEVAKGRDEALMALTRKYDGVDLQSLQLGLDDMARLSGEVPKATKRAIDQAYDTIYRFHSAQQSGRTTIETMPGVTCWREPRPIERVALYIPGGSAPLVSTVLMLGVPAQIAGCKEVCIVTPPRKDGLVEPAICYAAGKVGVSTIFTVGGAQAIAALCVGTQTVPKVDKIFGPGNQFVTAAKERAAKYGVAIDIPAGPSEVMVLADDSARLEYVVADLLSQAEHGPDSQVMLVTTSQNIADGAELEIARQLQTLPRADIARRALGGSRLICLPTAGDCVAFANLYAPEHLIIAMASAGQVAEQINNAGSVFIGNYTPESAGDYASGTNHTLPTNGWARSTGGVALDSFQKYVTFQQISADGLRKLAPTITELAKVEGLAAHARAVTIRLPE